MSIKRKPVVVGNWKMNLTLPEASSLAYELSELLEEVAESKVEVGFAPSTPFLSVMAAICDESPIGISAQHMSSHLSGAHTGESSAQQLIDVGCDYVILGHSERRHTYGETDEQIANCARIAHDLGLTPILCVGETLEQRESNQTLEVVLKQVSSAFSQLTPEEASQSICAYEPVWAIGTGRTASPQQAQEVHAEIRKHLVELFSEEVADSVRLQYGGSVKPENAEGLMSQPDIDGALVGGASLKVNSFNSIVQITSKVN